MVSKAREDLPDPDGPVTTVNARRGISRSKFLRLCCRAPLMTMLSFTLPIYIQCCRLAEQIPTYFYLPQRHRTHRELRLVKVERQNSPVVPLLDIQLSVVLPVVCGS